MFLILTRVLLWLVVAVIVFCVFKVWLSDQWKAWIGTFVIIFIAVGSFYNPNYWCVPYLWEVLAFFLKPLGISLVLIAVVISRINEEPKKKRGKPLLMIAFFILLICSIPLVAYKLAEVTEGEVIRLIRERAEIVVHPIPKTAQAIVLIGQGTTDANLPYRPQIQLTDTADRITYTAQIYHQQTQARHGIPPLVIVSAGPRRNIKQLDGNPQIEAEDIRDLLLLMGVPPAQIVLETEGENLRTIALEVKEILKDYQIDDEPVMLVTSALQMRRTALTFTGAELNIISRPTDFYTIQPDAEPGLQFTIIDIIPSAAALALTTRIIDEYYASVYYFLRGWTTPIVL
ncbi:MAG: YdcF family protein [Jaaginema sp. PMC 1079.18]|nr:YdcF family protein [Jaaginema sp. PMC 1080.18]MEC4849418.1 YdcF family protein [Jaaginema sp. PMC 1079.18]MEC4864950.1 YdcF family protein [Jaaginema sp. PMC 1078.18]